MPGEMKRLRRGVMTLFKRVSTMSEMAETSTGPTVEDWVLRVALK